MNETVTQGLFAMPKPGTGQQQFMIQLRESLATQILEFTSLEQIPHPFLWIELGCIGRQPFQVNACSRTSSQKVFDGLAVMDGGTIPDDQQLSRDLPQELLEKAHHILSLVGVILCLHEQSSFWCQRSDGPDVVPGQWHVQDRRFAHGSIGTYCHWKQVKARLIYKNDLSLFLLGFFLRAGQRSSFQVLMACSSLWVASSTGFCRLCLIARRRRLQCAG
jgi:hypothetical protein